MHIDSLRSYSNWVGETPKFIINEIKNKGGWKVVFPFSMPEEISRVRNFFNEYPNRLAFIPANKKNKNYKSQGCESQKWYLPSSWLSDFDEDNALTGNAYLDGYGRRWYQMVDVAGIYHFNTNDNLTIKKIKQVTFWDSPIFKLVCPDGTGGSMEVIIRKKICDRTKSSRKIIIKPGVVARIYESDIVKDALKRGSYNFSETTEVCSEQHTARDVVPHEKKVGSSATKAFRYYINPPEGSTLGKGRIFPYIDEKGSVFRAPAKVSFNMWPD